MAQPPETDTTPAEAPVDAPADDAQSDAAPTPEAQAVKPVPSTRGRRPAKAEAPPEAAAPEASDDPVAAAPPEVAPIPTPPEAEESVDIEVTEVEAESDSGHDDETDGDDPDPDGEHGEQPAARGPSRQRGLRAALASLPVPEPGPSFWADIDQAMAEQPPLQISARPAIRSINVPPPLSQPSLNDYYEPTGILVTEGMSFDDLAEGDDLDDEHGPAVKVHGADDDEPPTPLRTLADNRANARKSIIIAAGVVAAVLIIGSALGRGGDDPSGADTTTTAAEDANANPQTTVPTTSTTAPPVPGLDAGAKLTGNGIGSLRVGTSLSQLAAGGISTDPDQAMFTQNAGLCYVASVTKSPDLRLGLRSPDPSQGVANPEDGIIASVTITAAPGSTRVTERGLGLGATEQQVEGLYPEGIEKSTNPLLPGGHLMLARQDNDRGILYVTDGASVIEISVGEIDAITQRQGCS